MHQDSQLRSTIDSAIVSEPDHAFTVTNSRIINEAEPAEYCNGHASHNSLRLSHSHIRGYIKAQTHRNIFTDTLGNTTPDDGQAAPA